jgi:hypothetical protein
MTCLCNSLNWLKAKILFNSLCMSISFESFCTVGNLFKFATSKGTNFFFKLTNLKKFCLITIENTLASAKKNNLIGKSIYRKTS